MLFFTSTHTHTHTHTHPPSDVTLTPTLTSTPLFFPSFPSLTRPPLSPLSPSVTPSPLLSSPRPPSLRADAHTQKPGQQLVNIIVVIFVRRRRALWSTRAARVKESENKTNVSDYSMLSSGCWTVWVVVGWLVGWRWWWGNKAERAFSSKCLWSRVCVRERRKFFSSGLIPCWLVLGDGQEEIFELL